MRTSSTQFTSWGDNSCSTSAKETLPHRSSNSSKHSISAGGEAAEGHSSNSVLCRFLRGARSAFPFLFYCIRTRQCSPAVLAQAAGHVDFKAASSLHPSRRLPPLAAHPSSPATAAPKAEALQVAKDAATAAAAAPCRAAATFAEALAPASDVLGATAGHPQLASEIATTCATTGAAVCETAAAATFLKASTASAAHKEAAAAVRTTATTRREGETLLSKTAKTSVGSEVSSPVSAIAAAEVLSPAATLWGPAAIAARIVPAVFYKKGRGEGRARLLTRRLAASAAAALSAAAGAYFVCHTPAAVSSLSSFAAAAALPSTPRFLRLLPATRSPFLQFLSSCPYSSSKPHTRAGTTTSVTRSRVAAAVASSPTAPPVTPLVLPGSFIPRAPPCCSPARPVSPGDDGATYQHGVFQQQQQQLSQQEQERRHVSSTAITSSTSSVPSLFSGATSLSPSVSPRFPILPAGRRTQSRTAAAAARGSNLPFRLVTPQLQRHSQEDTTAELLWKGSSRHSRDFSHTPSASLLTTKAAANHGNSSSTGVTTGSDRGSSADGTQLQLAEDEGWEDLSWRRASTAAAAAAKGEETAAAATPEEPRRRFSYTGVPVEQEQQQQQKQQHTQEEQNQKKEEIETFLSAGMAWRCTGSSNAELVDRLRDAGVIKSPRVYEAMRAVDRGNFVDSCAYMDSPQPLGIGSATISAPHMHAAALEELIDHLKPGNRVLDVGSGSGYLTAVMAYAVGVKGIGDEKAATPDQPEGMAVGIDYVPGLVKYSQDHVKKAYPHLLRNPNFRLVEQDGWEGYAAAAPYDAIHVGAAAAAIPRRLLQQLKNGGKMVLPVEESLEGEIMIEEEEGQKPLSSLGRSGSSRSTGEGSSEEGSRGRRGRGIMGGGEEEETRSTARALWRRLLMGAGGQRFVTVTKDSEGKTHVKKLMGVMYVPLVKRRESSLSSEDFEK